MATDRHQACKLIPDPKIHYNRKIKTPYQILCLSKKNHRLGLG